jgi:hypothetical protein
MKDEEFFCKSPLLNSSLFPVGTGRLLNSTYSILPFLCDLLKVANDETVSPVLVEPPEFDISPFVDFSGLNGVGDPRVSLGVTITETLKHFLPRIITQTEVLQSGGSRLIDTYICDQDGNPIKQSTTVNALNSTSYKYGNMDIPLNDQSSEDLMKPLTGEEIEDFINNFILNEKLKDAEAFVKFIKAYYPNWNPEIVSYDQLGVCVVKLEDVSKTKQRYLKYYDDVKKNVACLLGKNEITINSNLNTIDNNGLLAAISDIIPNYISVMSDKTLQDKLYSKLENRNSATNTSNYNSMFEQFKNAEFLKKNTPETINKMISDITVPKTTQKSTTIKVESC